VIHGGAHVTHHVPFCRIAPKRRLIVIALLV
jgi:hypothetical protein